MDTRGPWTGVRAAWPAPFCLKLLSSHGYLRPPPPSGGDEGLVLPSATGLVLGAFRMYEPAASLFLFCITSSSHRGFS